MAAKMYFILLTVVLGMFSFANAQTDMSAYMDCIQSCEIGSAGYSTCLSQCVDQHMNSGNQTGSLGNFDIGIGTGSLNEYTNCLSSCGTALSNTYSSCINQCVSDLMSDVGGTTGNVEEYMDCLTSCGSVLSNTYSSCASQCVNKYVGSIGGNTGGVSVDNNCMNCALGVAQDYTNDISTACFNFDFNGTTFNFESTFCDPACRRLLFDYIEEYENCDCATTDFTTSNLIESFLGCGGEETSTGLSFTISWSWSFTSGDPHFTTLDGFKYTFNGLGDYWLLKGRDEKYGVKVQGRFIQCGQATCTKEVAIGLGIGSNSKTGIVELKEDATLSLKVDGVSKSPGSYDSLALRGDLATVETTKVEIESIAGVKVVIEVVEGVLTVGMACSKDLESKVFGLYGNFDGNSENDLEAASSAILPSNSTEREIYNQFGQTWSVQPSDSLFPTSISTNNTFVPLFSDEIQVSSESEEACATVPESEKANCLFDVTVTNDVKFAKVSEKSAVIKADLEKQTEETFSVQKSSDSSTEEPTEKPTEQQNDSASVLIPSALTTFVGTILYLAL